MSFFTKLLMVFAIYVLPVRNVDAYLDPGSGSYIIQVLIALCIGSIITIKIYWKKIKDFIKSYFKKNPPNSAK